LINLIELIKLRANMRAQQTHANAYRYIIKSLVLLLSNKFF